MKGNKGITLIALVITIIVLLILAGVSIAMLAGNNSILGRAQSTVYMNEIGEGKDFVALAWNAAYAEYLNKYYTNTLGTGANAATLSSLFGDELDNAPDDAKFTAVTTKEGSGENEKTYVVVTSNSDTSKKSKAELTITNPSAGTTAPSTGELGAWSAVN